MTTMIVSKEGMKDMMKIVKPPKEYDLLIKGFWWNIRKQSKRTKR